MHLVEHRDCLMVGDPKTGYIVAPDSVALRAELEARCVSMGYVPADWVRVFRLQG